jgi:hypothetical protein
VTINRDASREVELCRGSLSIRAASNTGLTSERDDGPSWVNLADRVVDYIRDVKIAGGVDRNPVRKIKSRRGFNSVSTACS